MEIIKQGALLKPSQPISFACLLSPNCGILLRSKVAQSPPRRAPSLGADMFNALDVSAVDCNAAF